MSTNSDSVHENIRNSEYSDSIEQNTGKCSAFELLRKQRVESLGILVEEYQHIKTGAMHYHLASDNPENVFLVALRTVPMDSTGVAHILEHTALCGSEKYPVRDPFFMMIKRSLNTFMNAFTSSDWTAYPFASKNKKDFFNLMDVYLDAVFFARLDPLDFAQEGHRVEFEDPKDPNTRLEFKGVVFNEMKGAMSSPVSTLWQKLTSNLYPTTTYHYNSGGEPENIPDLSHEQLISFYKKHYHPSNAIFMTYGNIPASTHQKRFEENALSRFEKLDLNIEAGEEVRFDQPKEIEDVYAVDQQDMDGNKTHIVMSWLLGKSTHLEEQIRAQFLSNVLLDNGSSPLRFALETTDLGHAPSPLCGVEDSNREMCFVCGLEGSIPENAEKVEKLILDVLNNVAENGVSQDQLESVLHQLELHQREISGDGYPYGLHLILGGLTSAIHRGDPVALLNIDPVLEKMREEIKDPDFIKNLVRSLLLNNNHRIRLTLKPDTGLSQLVKKKEEERLSVILKNMNDDEKNNIIVLSEKLVARQNQEDNPEVLPKVGLDDVPPKMEIIEGEDTSVKELPLSMYSQATNGLVYQQIVTKLPLLKPDQLQVLPYLSSFMTELGCGKLDYLETQAWQDRVSGGIHAYTSIRSDLENIQNTSGYFILSGKALSRNYAELLKLMEKTLTSVHFDEHKRIIEIIAQQRAGLEQSVTGNGHTLAMMAAASGISPVAALSHQLRGLTAIKNIKQLDEELKSKSMVSEFSEKLVQIHSILLSSHKQLVLVSEKEFHSAFQNQLEDILGSFKNNNDTYKEFSLEPASKLIKQAWTTSTQVTFCAKAYPTVTMDHPDAAALAVLGGFLRNGYLHRAIREQGGAYGGGASQDSESASFRFYSYRDPRLGETLVDFDQSIEWLLNSKHEWRQAEEAILGVIGKMDKTGSPAGEAKNSFYNRLFGRTPEKRQLFRERVLSVSLDDLKRAGEQYLTPEKESVAVICNPEKEDECKNLGLDIISL